MQDHMEVRPHMGFFSQERRNISREALICVVSISCGSGPSLCCFAVFLLAKRKSGREICGSSHSLLHSAPIFRLLLKVAVNRTHQCDFLTCHSRPRGAVGIAALLCR